MTETSPTAERLTRAVRSCNLKEFNSILLLPNISQDCTVALGFAACLGNTVFVDLLLPFSSPKDNDSAALRMAAAKGHVECVRSLLPLSNANACNGEALSVAAENNHPECIALLLPATADQWHSHALYAATMSGHTTCIELLLGQSSRPVEVLDEMKRIHPDQPQWQILEHYIQFQHLNAAVELLDPPAKVKSKI